MTAKTSAHLKKWPARLSLTCVLFFATFAFSCDFRWHHGGGGSARSETVVGLPWSPWLTIARRGVGDIDVIAWGDREFVMRVDSLLLHLLGGVAVFVLITWTLHGVGRGLRDE